MRYTDGMVRQTIDAIYENGVLRPLAPLTGVPEHGVNQLVASSGVLNATIGAAEAYAQIGFDLRRRGTPIPENDIWIAAICIENDLPLWTDDAHFSNVSGLRFFTP
jgi:hypothetical protein